MATLCLKRKNLGLTLFLFLITCFSLKAQLNPAVGAGAWKFANPQPHGFSMVDMSFADNNTGLAVGGGGGLARTTDGGRNWQYLPFKFITPTNTITLANFTDVQMVTNNIAYAVGGSGLMVKSTDGGMTWTPITTPLTPFNKNINAVHFLNKDTGYIGGAAINSTNTTNINDAPKIYFTRNGGATWDSLVTPFRPQQNAITLSAFNQSEIHRIHFVNDSVGYVSGSCGNVSANYSAILWKIEKHVVKDYSIHRSKFGITATTGSYTPATQTYKGLLGINDSLVIMSSLNNNVVIRVKTGKNDSTANAIPATYGAYERGVYEIVIWLNSTAAPYPAPLAGNVAGQMMHLKRGPDGKIFLISGNAILWSSDNGTSWAFTRPTPSSLPYAHWGFSSMDITPNGRIVAGSFNGLTYDSLPGSPWTSIYKNARPLFYSFSDIDWADFCNGIAVGSSGTIIKTTDGGKNWTDISNPILDAAQMGLHSLFYHAVNNMYFCTGTTVFRSPDQGATLDALFTEPNTNSTLNAMTMVGTSKAWVVGYRFSPAFERTMIFRSLNANAVTPTWDTVKTFPTGTFAPQLRNIKFANQDTGYTCGNRGKIYRTINGGTTWTDVSPDTTINSNGTTTYTGLSLINGKTIFLSGSSRKLFRSTDAGATWTDLTIAVPPSPTVLTSFTALTNIIMNDVDNGYIQAGNILMRTRDGWSTWTYDLAPQAMTNISLYPKISLPLDNKKLYAMTLTAGFPGPGSTQTATLLEYGNYALVNVNTSEATSDATCANSNGGSITVNATGGVTPYTYSINGGPFQSSNVFTGLSQGPKTITIKDAACQTVTKTVNIGFSDNLTLTTNNDTLVCAGAPVQLLANSAATTYSWTPSGGLNNASISNPIATVNSNTAFTVTASLNGCVRTKTINIAIKPNPVINAGPDKTIVEGDQVMLEGSGSNAVTISWSPATTLTGANTFTPVAKPAVTTPYTLTVKNTDNCTSTDITVVTVIPYCVKVMNAFTPNGDGMNDRWLVTNGADCTKKITVAVFNRYGNVVYKNDNYNNDWEGTFNGKPVPDGTYYYVVSFTTITDKIVALKGDVTILR